MAVIALSWRPASAGLSIRGARLQRKRVQRPTHVSLQRLIHHLVLLHTALAPELLRYDFGGIMVAVRRQLADRNPRIRQGRPDQALDVVGAHRHLINSPSTGIAVPP